MEFFVCFDELYKMAKKNDGVKKSRFALFSEICHYTYSIHLFNVLILCDPHFDMCE